MARRGLTDRQIQQAKQPGVLIDGDGLRLKIRTSAKDGLRKGWFLRVTVKGAGPREIGLGAHSDQNNTAAARRRAEELRDLARRGIDPLAHVQAELAARAAEAARSMSFREAAQKYIDAHKGSWRNAKHIAQWTSTLTTYAFPVFGDVPVGEVDQAMVMKVLDPIWATKTETASRVRGRIECVLDWAAVRGLRSGDNPARWRGHLQKALPPRKKVQRVNHHPALPYTELPDFMDALKLRTGIAAEAMQFVILTACRTSEGVYARWREIDLDKALWTIPAARMKAARDHRVPLSSAAIALLQRVRPAKPKADDWVFPGPTVKAKALSNMALLALLKRMGRDDLTVHGFRSTFRDWAAERTNFPREVAEAALAHVIGDKTEAAYRRGDLFEKRRRLMESWAAFCESPASAGQVINLRDSGG